MTVLATQRRYRHPGDLPKEFASAAVKSILRARYGGEEFAVILPETPHAGAIQAALNSCRDPVACTSRFSLRNAMSSEIHAFM